MRYQIGFFRAVLKPPFFSHLFQRNWWGLVIGPIGIVIQRSRRLPQREPCPRWCDIPILHHHVTR